jgi:hypothetical protein
MKHDFQLYHGDREEGGAQFRIPNSKLLKGVESFGTERCG